MNTDNALHIAEFMKGLSVCVCVCGDGGQDVLCVMETDQPAGGCGPWVSASESSALNPEHW